MLPTEDDVTLIIQLSAAGATAAIAFALLMHGIATIIQTLMPDSNQE